MTIGSNVCDYARAHLRELFHIARQHRPEVLAWIAQTGLSMSGMSGLLYGAGLVFGWHHTGTEGPSVYSRVVPALSAGVCVLAILAWALFTLRHVLAARITVLLFAGGATAWVLMSALTSPPGGLTAPHLGLGAGLLTLVPLLGFATTAYLAVPTIPARGRAVADPTDLALPRLGWPLALPFYLLAYATAFLGLYNTMLNGESLYSGSPRATIGYALAVLGFAVLGALGKRAIPPYAAIAAACCTTLGLPLALAGLLIARAASQPVGPLPLELLQLVVLTVALLWLAHRRATTARLKTTDAVATLEGSE